MDAVDHLEERAELVAHAIGRVSTDHVWGWEGYDWHNDLKFKRLTDGGKFAQWRHPWRDKSRIWFKRIRPTGVLDGEKVEEIPMGDAKIIDGVTISAENWDGIAPLPINYNADFGKTRTKAEALSIGFTESIEIGIKFTEGGEAAFFKAEQSLKLGFEARQDKTTSTEDSISELRSAGLTPTCPPGFDVDFWMTRMTQPTKMRVSGKGQLTHSISIGKRSGSNWSKKHGKGGKRYSRMARWDTFEDFLSVIKGEGRRDLALASLFRKTPASDWLIKRLEQPLEIPFTAETPTFDGWTKLRPHQKVIRGPNLTIIEKLNAYT